MENTTQGSVEVDNDEIEDRVKAQCTGSVMELFATSGDGERLKTSKKALTWELDM